MGRRRRCTSEEIVLLLSVALLLQQLALVPCVGLVFEPEPHREEITATEMSFYDLTAADRSTRRTCNATIGECNMEEEEMMESEISRRFLAGQTPPLSYGTLKADGAVCRNKDGKSYKCPLPSTGNRPNRGCEGHYQCRQK